MLSKIQKDMFQSQTYRTLIFVTFNYYIEIHFVLSLVTLTQTKELLCGSNTDPFLPPVGHEDLGITDRVTDCHVSTLSYLLLSPEEVSTVNFTWYDPKIWLDGIPSKFFTI